MITIKKDSENITSERIVKDIVILVNDKEINVNYYYSDDEIGGYDNDYNIDEKDKAKLTEDELEALEDNLPDLIKEEVGKIIEVK